MNKIKNFFSKVLAGSLIGFINGFFGGGGGMIVVPVLTKFFKYEEKKAHATSIAIILPISLISSFIYLSKENIQWGKISAVAAGVTLGGAIGAILLKKVNNKIIEYLFEGVMFAVGIKMLFFT